MMLVKMSTITPFLKCWATGLLEITSKKKPVHGLGNYSQVCRIFSFVILNVYFPLLLFGLLFLWFLLILFLFILLDYILFPKVSFLGVVALWVDGTFIPA
jgi:hypothetical protein